MNSAVLMKDLEAAICQLRNALDSHPETDIEKAGCIQYFEFCFELAWKTIKTMAGNAGVADVFSPKAALRHAFACGWIDDEETWLSMLASRNRMSHTYNAAEALSCFVSLPDYTCALEKLRNALKANA